MRGIEENKKGQQLTLSTIIIIVLGIMVLVFLVFGFSKGWNNLWNKVTNLGGGAENIGIIKQSCGLACSSQNTYDYCNLNRTVKFGNKVAVKEDCTAITKGEKTRKSCVASCEVLAKSQVPAIQGIGVSKCPGLCNN